MIAIIGGLVTAVMWGTALLASARSARLIGAWSTLGWVMLVGLVITLPFVFVSEPAVLSGRDLLHLLMSGIGNTVGLLLSYSAVRRGKVAIVGPIVSTEGAVAALFAIIAGDQVSAAALGILALIAVGVVFAAVERSRDDEVPAAVGGSTPANASVTAAGQSTRLAVLFAIGAAVLFAFGLYATSRLATDVPLVWTTLPARVAGVVGVTIPLVLSRRLTISRAAAPFVVLVGLAEVAGVVAFALGARDSAPIAAVVASQFAGVAAIAAFILFGERLSRLQVAGVVIIAVGVAALALVQG